MDSASLTVISEAASDSTLVHEKVGYCKFHENIHPHVNALLLEGSNYFEPCRITDMRQSRVSVSTKVPLIGHTFFGSIEYRSPSFQFSYSVWSLLSVYLCHPPVIQVFTALHGVSEMSFPGVSGVLVTESRRSSSLSHDGMRLS